MKYIEYDSSFGEEEKKQAKTLKVACNLNNAACKLKLKETTRKQKNCVPRYYYSVFHPLRVTNLVHKIMTFDVD